MREMRLIPHQFVAPVLSQGNRNKHLDRHRKPKSGQVGLGRIGKNAHELCANWQNSFNREELVAGERAQCHTCTTPFVPNDMYQGLKGP
jgi:hypothetical protein